MPKQDFKFKTPVRVRWMEGDAQGIVFNGSYLGYLEIAQAEYFRNLGFSIYQIAKAGYFDTAVVKTTLEFKAPARVDQMLDLHARVAAIGTTSLTLEVEIYPQDSDQLLTNIQAIYVGFTAQTGETRPVPGEMRALVDHFEATGQVLPLTDFPELARAAS